jgi:hypothetical protein
MSYYGRPTPVGLENMGKLWNNEEKDLLLNEIKENKPHSEIARSHKRTIGSIISKLRTISAELHLDEKKTIQQCIEITGLDMTDILDAIDKYEYNKRTKAVAAENKAKLKEKTLSKHVDITSERSIVSKHVDHLHELRCDVNELKKDVKEILRLMNALYDFEASQN